MRVIVGPILLLLTACGASEAAPRTPQASMQEAERGERAQRATNPAGTQPEPTTLTQSNPTTAPPTQWRFEVIYPDKEIRRYEVDKDDTPVRLRKSGWRCQRLGLKTGDTAQGLPLEAVGISCRYDTDRAPSVYVSAGCTRPTGKTYDSEWLSISEKTPDGSEQEHVLRLECGMFLH